MSYLADFFHYKQNKCYPQSLPISMLDSIFAVANLLAHNNISQVYYCGQISLGSAEVNCSFSDNLSPFGGTNYFSFTGTHNLLICSLNCAKTFEDP